LEDLIDFYIKMDNINRVEATLKAVTLYNRLPDSQKETSEALQEIAMNDRSGHGLQGLQYVTFRGVGQDREMIWAYKS
jgi:hypothetical protein